MEAEGKSAEKVETGSHPPEGGKLPVGAVIQIGGKPNVFSGALRPAALPER